MGVSHSCQPAEARLYEHHFLTENTEGSDYKSKLNPDSLQVLEHYGLTVLAQLPAKIVTIPASGLLMT
jgi:hypothetical protein